MQPLVRRLCKAVLDDAVGKGFADLWDKTWNPTAHVEITLTIAELRCAAALLRFRPTAKQLQKAEERQDWREYLDELDGVE